MGPVNTMGKTKNKNPVFLDGAWKVLKLAYCMGVFIVAFLPFPHLRVPVVVYL